MRGFMLLVLLIAGCTTAPKPPPVADTEAAWQQHQRRLLTIQSWQLQGKLALRSEQQSGSAQLWWRQNQQRFDLRVTPPFGVGKLRIRGDDSEVILYPALGRPLRAANAEALLQQTLGWSLPLQSLRYWVLGLPAEAEQIELDDQGRLHSLAYQGWQVKFIAYEAVADLMLPSELFLRYQDLQLRLAIHEWQLNPHESPPSSRLRPPSG